MTDVLSTSASSARPRFRAINVLALVANAAAQRSIEAALNDREQFKVRVCDTHDLGSLEDAIRGLGPVDLIVIDADLSDMGAGPPIERVIGSHFKGVPVLVLASALQPDATRRLMRMGVSEILDAHTPASDISDAAIKSIGARKTQAGTRLSAFFSPRGGVGVSTLAVEFAVRLARERPESSAGVCLIDLNLQFGVCASLLNVEPGLNVGAGALDPKRVDAQLLEAFLTRHSSGLYVLAAPADWRPVNISAEAIGRLLDAAAARFDQLVIDLPHQLGPITEAVLSNVDDLFVVSDLSVPGLQLARSALINLDSRMRSGAQSTLILNRVPKQSHGTALTLKDVRRVISSSRIFVVHDDPAAAAEASERGDSIVRMLPESRLAKDICAAFDDVGPLSDAPRRIVRQKSVFFPLPGVR